MYIFTILCTLILFILGLNYYFDLTTLELILSTIVGIGTVIIGFVIHAVLNFRLF